MFIGLGSARCGSTWLHRNLERHPDITLPERKELRYLDKRVLKHDLNWYREQFEPAEGCAPTSIRGEITPFYCRIQPPIVRQVFELIPNLRTILVLRNPVDRTWSHAKLDFHHWSGRDLNDVSLLSLMRYASRRRSRWLNDYARAIRSWSTVEPDSLLVERFESIAQEPQELLKRVLTHIGADPSVPADDAEIGRKVVPEGDRRQELDIPEALSWYIASLSLPDVRELNSLLDGRVSDWVEDLESRVNQSRPGWQFRRLVGRLSSIPEQLSFAAYDLRLQRRLAKRWQALIAAG